MGKRTRGDRGERVGGWTGKRSFCRIGTSRLRQDTKRYDYNKRQRQGTSYMGTAVDGYGKGGSYESFFPISEEQATTKKIPIFPELTTILTGYGKTCSY